MISLHFLCNFVAIQLHSNNVFAKGKPGLVRQVGPWKDHSRAQGWALSFASLNFEVIWHSQSFAFCAVCSCSAMTCRASELQKLNHKRSPRLAQLTGRRSKRAIWRSSSVDGKSWKRQARTVQYCAPSNVEHAKLVLSFYIILIQWKNLPRLCSSTCNKSQTIW